MHTMILLCLLNVFTCSLFAAADQDIQRYDIASGIGGAICRSLCGATSHLTFEDHFLRPNQRLFALLDTEASSDINRVEKAFAALKKEQATDADVQAIFSPIMQKVENGLILMLSDDRAIIFSKGCTSKAILILQEENEFASILPDDRRELVTTSWMYDCAHRGLVLSRNCSSTSEEIAKAAHAALNTLPISTSGVAAAVLALKPQYDGVVVYLDSAALVSPAASDGDRSNPLLRTRPDRIAKTKKCSIQ